MDKETKQMFELILEKLGSMETKMGTLETKMGTLETKMGTLETKMGTLETKMGTLETKMGTLETKQEEIFRVVKAIEHSNNTGKAEIDNLNHRVSIVEGTLNSMGEVFQ